MLNPIKWLKRREERKLKEWMDRPKWQRYVDGEDKAANEAALISFIFAAVLLPVGKFEITPAMVFMLLCGLMILLTAKIVREIRMNGFITAGMMSEEADKTEEK